MTNKMQSLAKRLISDKLFFNSAVIFFFVMIGNFFNYLFQISMSRSLSVADYGTLNSLLSLLIITGVPAGALIIFSAKNISTNLAINDVSGVKKFIKHTLARTFLYDCLLLLIFFICIPFLMEFMKVNFYLYYVMVGMAIFLIFPYSFILGGLQGSRMYLSLGLLSSISSVIRFILAVILVYAGLNVIGALLSGVISPVIIILVAVIILFSYLKHKQVTGETKHGTIDIKYDKENGLKQGTPYFIFIFFILFFFTFFTNIDLIVVKHFFPTYEVGIYSVADILGKIILYFPAAIVLVVFPEVSHAHATNSNTKHLLLKAIFVTFLMCSFLEMFYILFPDKIISFLMGVKYITSAPLLTLYGLSMFPFAFINIFINYFMAINNSKILISMFLFSIMEVGLFYLFHNSLKEIIIFIMITGWLVLFTLSFYAFHEEFALFFNFNKGKPILKTK